MIAEAQQYLIGKSPLFAAIYGVLFGLVSDSTGLLHSNNAGLVVALCGVLGAFVASIPKLYSVRSHAKLSESEFIGSRMEGLINRLQKQATDNDQISGLQVAVRHEIQGHYQAAIWHIALLEDLLKRANVVDVPHYKQADVAAMLKELDRQIVEIKTAEER